MTNNSIPRADQNSSWENKKETAVKSKYNMSQ